jgi:hypothetical protein
VGVSGELPPLLVKAHGGPTSAASTDFNPCKRMNNNNNNNNSDNNNNNNNKATEKVLAFIFL